MRLTRARCLVAAFYTVLLFSAGIAQAQSKAAPSITVYKTPT